MATRAPNNGHGNVAYNVHVPAYEGPLDLLLDLIRKQEMDIHNIPIATITGQYLEYLHNLEQLDMDISADFIYMAATLILIKSKMLLPADPLAGPEELGDPRAELVYRLVEHEKFKNAAQLLHQKQQIEDHVWSKPDMSLYQGDAVEGDLVVSLVDLVRVFQQVLERRKQVTRIELHRDEFTVGQMMRVLRAQLAVADGGLELSEFFEARPSRMAMICALLAVLEMVRLGAILLVQGELFSTIRVRKHKMFDAVFANADAAGAKPDPARDAALDDGPPVGETRTDEIPEAASADCGVPEHPISEREKPQDQKLEDAESDHGAPETQQADATTAGAASARGGKSRERSANPLSDIDEQYR